MKDRLSPDRTGRQLLRIVVAVDEVGVLWLEALEAGVYPRRSGEGGRPSTFSDTDPTSTAALSPTQRQIRYKAARAATLIEQAMERLEQAQSVLKDGFLLSDEDVLSHFLEKRTAATQYLESHG